MFELIWVDWIRHKKANSKEFKGLDINELELCDMIIKWVFLVSINLGFFFMVKDSNFFYLIFFALALVSFSIFLVRMCVKKRRFRMVDKVEMYRKSHIGLLIDYLEKNQLDPTEKIKWLISCCNQKVKKKTFFAPFKSFQQFAIIAVLPVLLIILANVAVNFLVLIVGFMICFYILWLVVKMFIVDPYYDKYSSFCNDLEYILSERSQ